MNKLFIDIDNNTPGAIILKIAAFLKPECLLQNTADDLFFLSVVNKYFNKCIEKPHCKTDTFFDQKLCDQHSPEYRDLKFIHFQIQEAKNKPDQRWVHFISKEMANKALKFLEKDFDYYGKCCDGKGVQIRGAGIPKHQYLS